MGVTRVCTGLAYCAILALLPVLIARLVLSAFPVLCGIYAVVIAAFLIALYLTWCFPNLLRYYYRCVFTFAYVGHVNDFPIA